MSWANAVVIAARRETREARTLVLRVEGWPGHNAGQHVDVRLTAEDGYTAVRSYSIASAGISPGPRSGAPGPSSGTIEITVDRLVEGEVSPHLVDEVSVGDRLEIRGPAGGWFVWQSEDVRPVQLIGGGSGVVPLMAMIRTHGHAASAARFRLLYSVRSPALELFAEELRLQNRADAFLDVTWAYTRATPLGWPQAPARLDRGTLDRHVFAPSERAMFFVCGSTPFVESVANWLVDAGHEPADIRTERYGGVALPT